MQIFAERLRLETGTRVLDLGGNPRIWSVLPQRLHVTILNLPGHTGREKIPSHHELRFVEGDACALDGFGSGDFDVVFSNSVIEHVGDSDRQEAFARTVRRLGRRFWVQTPARWFPIEAHTGVPFWWFLPESSRNALLRHWHRKLPA
jgi:SAM-dependent methyltransferase